MEVDDDSVVESASTPQAAVWRHSLHARLISFSGRLQESLISQEVLAQPFRLLDPFATDTTATHRVPHVAVSEPATLAYLARKGAQLEELWSRSEQLMPGVVAASASIMGFKLPFQRVEREFALLNDQHCFCIGRIQRTPLCQSYSLRKPSRWYLSL